MAARPRCWDGTRACAGSGKFQAAAETLPRRCRGRGTGCVLWSDWWATRRGCGARRGCYRRSVRWGNGRYHRSRNDQCGHHEGLFPRTNSCTYGSQHRRFVVVSSDCPECSCQVSTDGLHRPRSCNANAKDPADSPAAGTMGGGTIGGVRVVRSTSRFIS